ncbi:unnamed protein product [Polarella glacialis]|uniref:Uncharacterized protein n=1 Tax=Polarella glacialis TaxID=89957 RepID=A0A813FW15_POLGL|nr:unnamed protein product [Polarella glacialis]
MSMVGSALNIIGSIGFLPNVMAISPLLGILGFIGGSLAIGVSQAWKVVRISGDGGICSSKDNFTAACVEGGACLGAWGFFFGTLLFWIWPFEGTRTRLHYFPIVNKTNNNNLSTKRWCFKQPQNRKIANPEDAGDSRTLDVWLIGVHLWRAEPHIPTRSHQGSGQTKESKWKQQQTNSRLQ